MRSIQLPSWTMFLGLASLVTAQTNDWENEAVYGINKLPARATSFSFVSEALAHTGDRSQARQLSLNGEWRFHFTPDSKDRPLDFSAATFDASSWAKIDVPSNW